MKLKDLTDEELIQLRRDVILGSVYIKHYINALDVDPKEAADFFTGYEEDMFEQAAHDPNFSGDPKDIYDVRCEYDNDKNLIRYFHSVDFGE